MNTNQRQRKVGFIAGNGKPIAAIKVLPNSPCPCGSGKKAKKCCGAKTKYFTTKEKELEKPTQPPVITNES